MKNFQKPARTIVAIMISLAFSGAALAAADEKGNSGETAKPVPSMKGDMGKRTASGASTSNSSDEKGNSGETAKPVPSMKGDMGKRTAGGASTNISDEKGATANPTGSPAMSSGMGNNRSMNSGTSTYNSSMMTIKNDYKDASAKCKAMPRADRGSCMTDAKSARNSETMKAKEMRKSAMGSGSMGSGSMGSSGSMNSGGMSGTPEKKKGTGSY